MTLHFSAPVSPASSVSSYEHSHHQPWLLGGLDAKHPWKANGEVGTTAKSHDSGSSNCSVEVECHSKFKELTAENLKLLCAALEKEAPWQREVIPEIASTVLRCRSMMAKRRDTSRSVEPKEETWLLFLGGDADGKEKVARKLASLVFGSRKNFLSISLDSSSPSPSGSTEEHRRKRPRQEASQAYLERLYQTIAENPHRVIMMEDVEEADKYCQLGIKEAIESGVVRSHRGEEAAVGDAIFILSCEGFDARSRACSPPSKQMKVEREHASDHGASSSSSSCFDLNLTVEGDAGEQCYSGHVGLLKAVDRTLFFRIPEDL